MLLLVSNISLVYSCYSFWFRNDLSCVIPLYRLITLFRLRPLVPFPLRPKTL